MEKSLEKPPKRVFYLVDAIMKEVAGGKRISATVARNISTLNYNFGSHIETLLITINCGNHVFESEESIYYIIDGSL